MENKEQHEQHLINKISNDTKKSMKSRILTALIIVLVTIPCVFLGDFVFFLFMTFIAIVGTHEIVKIPQGEIKFKNVVVFFSYFMMLSLVYWIFIKNNLVNYVGNRQDYAFGLSLDFDSPQISLIVLTVSVLFFFLMPMIDKNFKVFDSFFYISMILLLSIGIQSLLFVRLFPFTENSNIISINGEAYSGQNILYWSKNTTNYFRFFQSALLFLLLMVGTFGTDTGAYFTGVLFGKHKLCPSVSPKKTVEGFVGGVAISSILSMSILYTTSSLGSPILRIFDFNNTYLMQGNFEIGGWSAHLNIIIVSVVMPLISTFGDLLFSLIKRTYSLKDFGHLLKEHGGILDRIDSLLCTGIALSLLVVMMEHAWNPLG